MSQSQRETPHVEIQFAGGERSLKFTIVRTLRSGSANLSFNVQNNHESSQTIQIPHKISKELRRKLAIKGCGFFIKLFPSKVDAVLLPSASRDIWRISVIDGEIPKYAAQEEEHFALLDKAGHFRKVLNFAGMSKIPNLLIKKSFDELISKENPSQPQQTSQPVPISLDLPTFDASFVVNEYTEMDPIVFFADRYYSMLYTEKSMLTHFLKSSLPKLYLMCKKDNNQVFKIINQLLFSDFERLHSKYSNAIIQDGIKLKEFQTLWISKTSASVPGEEKQYKKLFCENLYNNIPDELNLSTSETFRLKWSNLKLKETQLQLILALEALKLINSADTNIEQAIPSPKSKPVFKKKRNVLVGKQKKRLMPTLLGTVISQNFDFDFDFRTQATQPLDDMITTGLEDHSNVSTKSSNSLNELIDLLFEDLIAIDAVSDRSPKDPQSAYSFVVSCLVPYYKKDHLQIFKRLVSKIRDASYLSKRKSKKDKERKVIEKRKKQEQKLLQRSNSHKDQLQGLKNELNLNSKDRKVSTSDLKLKRANSSFTSSLIDMERKGFNVSKSSNSLSLSQRFSDDILSSTNTLSDELINSNNGFATIPSSIGKKTLGGFMTSMKKERELKEFNDLKQKELLELPPPKDPVLNTPQKIKEREFAFNSMFPEHQNLKAGGVIESTPAKHDRVRSLEEFDDSVSKRHRLDPEHHTNLSAIIESPYQIKRSPIKGKIRKLGIGNQSIIEETPVKRNNLAQISSTPIRGNDQQVFLTRDEVKPGVFQISSSPVKSPEGTKVTIMESPIKDTQVNGFSMGPPVINIEETPAKSTSSMIIEINSSPMRSPINIIKHASTRIKLANTPSKPINRRLQFD